MIPCPHKGCGGYLDEWCCTGCGKIVPLSSLLGHVPVTEKVQQEQESREELALRSVT